MRHSQTFYCLLWQLLVRRAWCDLLTPNKNEQEVMVCSCSPRHLGNSMAFAPSAVKVHSLRRVVYWHRGHRGAMLSHLLSWVDGQCLYELAYALHDRSSCWRNYALTCIRHPALFDGSRLYVAILIRRVRIISWIEFHYIHYLPIYLDNYSASGWVEPVCWRCALTLSPYRTK